MVVKTPLSNYHNWIKSVIQSNANLGMWINSSQLHYSFSKYMKTQINQRAFHARMTSISRFSSKLYKKKTYCINQNKYVTWYLFLLSDRKISDNDIQTSYTHHAPITMPLHQLSDRIISDNSQAKPHKQLQKCIPITCSSKWFSPKA